VGPRASDPLTPMAHSMASLIVRGVRNLSRGGPVSPGSTVLGGIPSALSGDAFERVATDVGDLWVSTQDQVIAALPSEPAPPGRSTRPTSSGNSSAPGAASSTSAPTSAISRCLRHGAAPARSMPSSRTPACCSFSGSIFG